MDIFFQEKKDKKKKIIFDAKLKRSKKQEEKNLRKAVNEFDKSFGCDLKHPKDLVDTEYEYSKLLDKAKADLTRIACNINEVNPKKYVRYDDFFGSSFRKIKVNKKFLKHSKFFDSYCYPTYDPRFMLRFLTYLLAYLIKHVEDIVNISFKLNKDGKWIEFDQKVMYLETLMERFFDLFHNVISGKDISYDLLYFHEMMLYLDNPKKKSVRKAYDIYENTTCLDDLCKLFKISKESTRLSIILESAYLVCTKDYKVPEMVEDVKWFYTKNELRDKITILGAHLRKSMKKNGVPKMFRYFLRSNPLGSSFWQKERSRDFKRGMYAIQYYIFLTGDKRIARKVESFMEI